MNNASLILTKGYTSCIGIQARVCHTVRIGTGFIFHFKYHKYLYYCLFALALVYSTITKLHYTGWAKSCDQRVLACSGILHSTSCLVSHILLTLRYQAVNILYVHDKIIWSDNLIRWWDLITWHAFNPMGTSLSTLMRCPTAISRNDPISLANEIHKSPPDELFHMFFFRK